MFLRKFPFPSRAARLALVLMLFASSIAAAWDAQRGLAPSSDTELADRSVVEGRVPPSLKGNDGSGSAESSTTPTSVPGIYLSTPFGSTVWWPEHEVVVSLCDTYLLSSHSVTSATGTVISDAAAQCPPGTSGVGYFVRWAASTNNIMNIGDNGISVSVCNQYYQCTYQSGAIKYFPPIDSLTVVLPAEPQQISLGSTASVSFVIFSHHPTDGYTYDSLAVSCHAGLANCSLQTAAPVETEHSGDQETIVVQVRADSIGPRAVTLELCRSPYVCLRRSQTVAVVPSVPVAAAVTVRALTPLANRANASSFSLAFRVKNTGTASTTYTLDASCDASVIVSGCSTSATTTLAAGDSATVMFSSLTAASQSVATTGTVRLSARAGVAFATAQSAVTIGPNSGANGAPQIIVSTQTQNPQGSVAREQCLMFAAGEGAGVECGDLRLAHALPAVQSMSRARSANLIYLSRHAEGIPLLNVRVKTLYASPTTVTSRLQIVGQAVQVRQHAWPAACRNVECRLVVPVNPSASPLPTGWYQYSLQVEFGASPNLVVHSDTGSIAVVNRSTSPYGRGWWLEGLEQIVHLPDTTRKLWIGGDGSTRVYVKPSPGSSVYLSVYPLARKDSLKRVASNDWRRLLPNGAYTQFDNTGAHKATVSAQAHVTSFLHDSGSVARITLPTRSATLKPQLRFFYTGAGINRVLDSVQVRSDSLTAPRTTKLSRTGSRITGFTDADLSTVQFAVNSTTGRVERRLNHMLDTTLFYYDTGGAIASVRRSMSRTGDDHIITRFCVAETRSLAQCDWGPATPVSGVPLVDAVTRIDGPRAGLIDVMTFHINRFGAPDTLQDSHGGRTRIVRSDIFPILVARVTDPLGLITRAWYDTAGRVDSMSAPGPSTTAAVTRMWWNAKWAMPDSVLPPLGAITRYFNNATFARVDSQQLGSDVATRVRFSFDSLQQMTSVSAPGGTEVFGYDARGNVNMAQSGNSVTYIVRDRWGADSVTYDSALFLTTRTYRNILGRVDSTRATSRSVSYTMPFGQISGATLARTRVVINGYDALGNLTSVGRRDADGSASSTQATSYWSYDAARRVRSRTEATVDSFWYDPAGLEIRRKSARGHVVTQQYDAMGRLTARIIPEVVYLRESCITCTNYLTLNAPIYFPYYQTALLGGGQSMHLVIPGDVESFTYDAAGRMLTANNRDARVSRTYYNNGALKSDTLRIRPYDTADTLSSAYNRHVFGQTYGSDLVGRRTSRSDWLGHTQVYSYHSAHGQLVGLDDVFGSDTIRSTFTWDAAGRPLTTSRAGVVTETRAYDDNGRLESRDIGSLFNDDYEYDSRGKLSSRSSGSSFTALSDSVKYWYDGFGAVAASDTYRQYGGINSASTEFYVDALGNVFQDHLNRGYTVGQGAHGQTYTGERVASRGTVRLGNLRQAGNPSQPRIMVLDSLTNGYDQSGNLRSAYTAKHLFDYSVPYSGKGGTAYNDYFYLAHEGNESTRHFYDGAQRLRQFERNVLNGSPWHTVQQYRYDALGRRVLLRTLRDSTRCSASQAENTAACLSTIDRFVWDGDQLVAEYRAKGRWNATAASLDSLWSTGNFFGIVRYVHAAGIDDPILVAKTGTAAFIPVRSGRGGFEAGLWLNGTDMTAYHWPARADGIYPGPDVRYEAPVASSWYGSLLDNKTDASGMIYMRNRYYDPGTGRFTQRDPIGLAGGINQYGYAGGDPVNRSDPFGLRDIEVEGANSRRIVAFLMKTSETFREAYNRLDNDHSVSLTIRDARDPLRAGVGANSFTPGADGKSGTIVFNDIGLNQANVDLFSMDPSSGWMFTAASVMGHEMGHANAFLGNGASGCKSDSPPNCILDFENKVRSELPANARGGTRTRYSTEPGKP